jgi:hypothetical protein
LSEFRNEIAIGIAVGILAGLAFFGLVTFASSGSTMHPPTTATNSSQVTTTQTSSCSPVGGKALYVRLVKDNTSEPIPNTWINYTEGYTCVDEGGTTEVTTAIISGFQTNSSGIASLHTIYSSWYDLIVHYSGHTYSLRADMRPNQTTYVTVKLPSGDRTLTHG